MSGGFYPNAGIFKFNYIYRIFPQSYKKMNGSEHDDLYRKGHDKDLDRKFALYKKRIFGRGMLI